MSPRQAWLWAAALALAVPAYYALSRLALERFLERAAEADAIEWRQGLAWEFDRRDDLAGPPPPAIAGARIENSRLLVTAAGAADFVSLNLRGREIDARAFPRLRLGIEREREGHALLFFRESLDGPDFGSPPLPLAAGTQELRLALDELPWQRHPPQPGADALPWGGASGTVASLRLHPVVSGSSDFALDFIALERAGAAPQRGLQAVALDDAAARLRQRGAASVLVLSDPWPRPARVMELKRRLERSFPASSVVLAPPGRSRTAPGGATLPLLAASLGLALAAFGLRRRPRLAAALWLASITVAAAAVLTNPAPTRDPAAWAVAGWLGLTLAFLAIGELRQPEVRPLGSAAAWRRIAVVGVAGLLPAALLVWLAPPVALPAPAELGARWLWYLPWAALQQLLLCAVLYRLCRLLPLPAGAAGALAALLFGLGHFPNFELMLGTFALAAACLAVYQRDRAIAPLALLHATWGGAYLSLLPEAWLFSGAVGMRYFG